MAFTSLVTICSEMAAENTLICNDKTVDLIFNQVTKNLILLDQHFYLINSFVIDFFVDDLWNKLPQQWQETLQNVDPLILSKFVDPSQQFKSVQSVWPISLLSFRAAAFACSLSRTPIDTMDLIYNYVNEKEVEERHNKTDLGIRKSSHLLNRRVKLKKRHEISRLSRIVEIVSSGVNCNRVIDVGSGQGHLSRNLAFEGSFCVTSFDAEDCHVSAAKKLDDKVLISMKKQNGGNCVEDLNLTHVAKFIPSNINEREFVKLMQENNEFKDESHFILVGLHTCGNLASTLLQVYSRCPSAVGLISVPCCYMKMDAQSYPLSQRVRRLPNSNLSYHAREASCHALEKHIEKLTSGDMSFLRIHCYRATLEALIVKYYPGKKHLGLRSVKNAQKMSFAEYVKIALNQCDLHIPEEEFVSDFVVDCMSKWKLVATFYFLRLILAVLVESTILLDKMLYLLENDIDSCLVPLFNPKLSPRNFVLLSIKK